MKACAFCQQPIPAGKRSMSIYCSRKCLVKAGDRKRTHEFKHGDLPTAEIERRLQAGQQRIRESRRTTCS